MRDSVRPETEGAAGGEIAAESAPVVTKYGRIGAKAARRSGPLRGRPAGHSVSRWPGLRAGPCPVQLTGRVATRRLLA